MINKTKTISKGWKKYILKDSVQFLRGSGLSKDKIVEGGKNKCVLYGELYTKYGEIIEEVQSRTNSVEGTKSKKGDILLPSSTTTKGIDLANAVAINEDNVLLGGDIIIIRDENNIFNSNYFAHYLTHVRKKDIAKITQGTTIIHLYSSGLKNLEVVLPPIKEQNKIAEILSKVDENIKKTDEIIKKTEKLKKGLMQELLTKGIGHKKFKKTELGEVPLEWKIIKLEDVADVERGKFSHRPRNAPQFYNGSFPFIQTRDVVNSNGKIKKYSQTLNNEGLKISRLFEKGTIVITIAANIGDTGILEFDSCFPDSLVGINTNKEMNNVFLEYFLRTRKNYLNSIATQSAQKNINLEKLRPLLVIKPEINEQKQIAKILSSVDNKIEINELIKNKLTQLKKGLINDLLSGKVRIKSL